MGMKFEIIEVPIKLTQWYHSSASSEAERNVARSFGQQGQRSRPATAGPREQTSCRQCPETPCRATVRLSCGEFEKNFAARVQADALPAMNSSEVIPFVSG